MRCVDMPVGTCPWGHAGVTHLVPVVVLHVKREARVEKALRRIDGLVDRLPAVGARREPRKQRHPRLGQVGVRASHDRRVESTHARLEARRVLLVLVALNLLGRRSNHAALELALGEQRVGLHSRLEVTDGSLGREGSDPDLIILGVGVGACPGRSRAVGTGEWLVSESSSSARA